MSLAQKVQELKARRLAEQAALNIRFAQAVSLDKNDPMDGIKERKHTTPGKRQTKMRSAITRGSSGQYGQLAGVPGASRNPYVAIVKQIAAPSTGTQVAKTYQIKSWRGPDGSLTSQVIPSPVEIRLSRSARNANTTQGNYNQSYAH